MFGYFDSEMMFKSVPLSTGLGEVMAPQTLVTALILSPDGSLAVEPGALHGRSAIEQSVRLVTRREELGPDVQLHWCVWVAIELDGASQPVRYQGVAASELWIDPSNRLSYKVLAESVNRMAEAMRGGVNLKTMEAGSRAVIGRQLAALSCEVWDRSPEALKAALSSASEHRAASPD